MQIYEYIRDNPQLTVNGFLKAGIPQAIDTFSSDIDSSDSDSDYIDR